MNVTAKTRKKNDLWKRIKKYWILYVLAIVPLAYLLIFCYWPIVLQFVLATTDFKLLKGIWGSEFVGLGNFDTLFNLRDFSKILFNSIRISGLRLVCGFFPPIILSIFLFDLSSAKFRRISQSILYIPHFFSWVIMYGIVLVLFQETGYINSIITFFGGEARNWMVGTKYFLPLLIGTSLWKGLGWSTIIYLAALSNVNPELFEAAKLDGAGPLQRIWHITLPGILPIVSFQLIMSMGSIVSGTGTEQILLFYNPSNYEVSDVIGTWVYRQGLGKLQYSMGAAVSVFESTVGLVLTLICNKVSSKVAGVGLW